MKPTKRYDVKMDLTGDTVYARILNLVGEGKRVLDVGCATGYLARALTEVSHCAVTGIEIDPGAAEEAKSCCERVVVGDIESMDLDTVLAGARFDVIIFADVLEHLVNPWRILANAKQVLADGFVVASLPNVAHAAVVLELLKGRFQYRPLGLLDDTHLRFFGKCDVVDLFEKAGYAIESFQRVYVAPEDTELCVNVDQYPAELVRLLETNDEATTYQFVVKARVAHGDAPARVAGANSAGERGILGHIKLLNEDRMVSRAHAQAVQEDRDRWRRQAEAVEEDRVRWRQQAEAGEEDRDRWRQQAEAAIRVATEVEAKLQAARSEVTRANANASALAAEFEAKLEAATLRSQVPTSLLRQRISITARLHRELLAAKQDKSDVEEDRVRWRQRAEGGEEDRDRWRQQAEAVQEDRDRWRQQAEAAIRVGTELEAKLQAARSEVTPANANASALAAEFEAKLEAATLRSQVPTSLLRQRISITARLHRELLAAKQDKSDYERQLQQIFRSRSWRLTAPIRFAIAKFRRLLKWANRRPNFRDLPWRRPT